MKWTKIRNIFERVFRPQNIQQIKKKIQANNRIETVVAYIGNIDKIRMSILVGKSSIKCLFLFKITIRQMHDRLWNL